MVVFSSFHSKKEKNEKKENFSFYTALHSSGLILVVTAAAFASS